METIIELNRKDLLSWRADLPIKDITLYDFKSKSMSMLEYQQASLVIFVDGEKVKELKNRYPQKYKFK